MDMWQPNTSRVTRRRHTVIGDPVPEVQFSDEEADSRIVLHARHARRNDSDVLSDVFLLLLAHIKYLTWLGATYAFFEAKFILAILLDMLISRKPVRRKGLGEIFGFFATLRPLPELKKVTNLFQIGLFPHKKVKFANFSTKQICNVKKKHFQCLVIN